MSVSTIPVNPHPPQPQARPIKIGVSDTVCAGVGAALFQVGAPAAWLLRDLAHGGKSPVFSAVLFVMGIALLWSPSAVRHGRLYASRLELGVLLAPLLFFTAFAALTRSPLEAGGGGADIRQLVTNIVLIGMTLAAYSRPVSSYRDLHRAAAIIGCLVAAASLLYAISSVGNFAKFAEAGRFGGFGDEANNGDSSPVTIARVAILTLLAAWLWFRENKERPGFAPTITLGVAFLTAAPMFLLARSRTNMLGVAALIALTVVFNYVRRFLYGRIRTRRKRGWTRFRIALVILFAVGAIVASVFVVSRLGPFINLAFEFLGRGISSMLGWQTGGPGAAAMAEDPSAAMRKSYLTTALNTFNLTGHGYSAIFVDDPALEAFYDFGVIGGLIYLIITVIIPLKICLDLVLRRTLPTFIKFGIASYVLQIIYLFTSTTPYEGNNWYFVIIFYAVVARYWSMGRHPESAQLARA